MAKLTDEQLAECAAYVSDQFGAIMDKYNKGLVPVFRCSHSGLYFPASYAKEWGRAYGIGLGPHPVSEILDTDYDAPLDMRDVVPLENISHPVQHCFAQVDWDMVTPADAGANMAIPAMGDHAMRRRMQIILRKQWQNPKGRLKRYRTDLVSVFGGEK